MPKTFEIKIVNNSKSVPEVSSEHIVRLTSEGYHKTITALYDRAMNGEIDSYEIKQVEDNE